MNNYPNTTTATTTTTTTTTTSSTAYPTALCSLDQTQQRNFGNAFPSVHQLPPSTTQLPPMFNIHTTTSLQAANTLDPIVTESLISFSIATEILRAIGLDAGAPSATDASPLSYFRLTQMLLYTIATSYSVNPFYWHQAIVSCIALNFGNDSCAPYYEKIQKRLAKICSLLLYVHVLTKTPDDRLKLVPTSFPSYQDIYNLPLQYNPFSQYGAQMPFALTPQTMQPTTGLGLFTGIGLPTDVYNATLQESQIYDNENERKRGVGYSMASAFSKPLKRAKLQEEINHDTADFTQFSGNEKSKDRASRNISLLCAKIKKELKKGPQTRDQLAATTDFARQRVCTVLSVFKAIGLVKEAKKRGEVEWNSEQELIIQNIDTHIKEIQALRQERKRLKSRESELIKTLLLKAHVAENG